MRVSLAVGPFAVVSLACAAAITASAAGCGATAKESMFEDAGGPAPSLSAGDVNVRGPCVNLECRRTSCGEGNAKTQLRGVVVSGSKTRPDPIYNAIVYIPNAEVEPLPEGASCDRCGTIASGKPIAVALTGPDGSFVLDDVPVGDDIPLVIQLGKWRRQVNVQTITACRMNEVPRQLTRMPRNRSEGDIPQIAIATGLVDPLECVLRKMGIDDDEFTSPFAAGRVHVYASNGSVLPGKTETPPADFLWSRPETLSRYDIVLLPCEGDEIVKPPGATQALIDYTAIGGRVMTSHFGYVWISKAQSPFPSTADWSYKDEKLVGPLSASIDKQASPKAAALSTWLAHLGVTAPDGTVPINEPRRDVGLPRNGSLRWMYASADPTTVFHLTFNTPVGEPPSNQCGRVVYSDFHVSEPTLPAPTQFPSECDDKEMTAAERVLEFMLYDLATCVQDETQNPTPPPIK